MFKTLLADDDSLVRKYLRTLDAWQQAGYEIIKDACDGEEALRIMGQEEIDVVITDISMPLMDGIELIRRIRKEWEQVYIIVLSCHDDFEYVKEAMRLGADEYILKNTLDETTLSELLAKTSHQIEAKQGKLSRQEETKKLIKMGSHTLKYHFFNGLLADTLKGGQREEKRIEAGIFGKYKSSAVICMFMTEWNRQGWTPLEAEQYSQEFRHGLMRVMESLLQEESDYAEIIYLGAGTYCCFLDMTQMCKSSAMRQHLTNVASACFRYCSEDTYSYQICVSSICIGEGGIRQAYQQVRQMTKYSFYDDSGILYYDIGKEMDTSLPREAQELSDMIGMIKNGRKEKELNDRFARLIDVCRRKKTEGRILVHWLKSLDEKAGILRRPETYQNLHKMDQFIKITEQYMPDMLPEEKKKIPPGVSGTVKYTLEFIHSNYKRQISLQDAADTAGVNAAYLSYLFKQEMGIGFSNYLQECRMECAKDLLQTTNWKIKDVAAEAGFWDYHYFSKAFKKLNNCSPAEFRKL